MRRHRANIRSAALGLIGIVTVLLAGVAASAEPRVALVIGNSHYGGDLGLLPNPVNITQSACVRVQ